MASEKVLYKAKDGTLVNLSTKVINNTATDSTTDALSAAQGKVLASKFTTLTKSSVGLGNVDNTADSAKSVKYATSAGSANAVDWSKVNNKPGSYTPAAHNQAWSTITDKPALMEAGEYSADTISALLVKVQGTSPRMGSTNITKETKIPNDWYNFIYTPHRTGVGGDNADYGTLLLFPMTSNGPSYIIRATKSGGVAHICKIYTDGNKPSKSDVGLGSVDNTADSAKSVKYATSAGSVAWGNVSGKPSTFTPASHTHSKSEVGLGNVDNTSDSAKSVKYATSAGSAGSVAWNNVTDKPSTFTPASHTHAKSEVGLGNVDNTADSAKSVKYATSAGSASSATTASKLGSATVGSASTPIYLNGGTATACTYTFSVSTDLLTPGVSDLATNEIRFVYD